MAAHQESAAKQATRDLIFDAAKHLQRASLTYLGMPAENAYDIFTLKPLLQNVICIDEKSVVLDETRRNIAGLTLKTKRFVVADIWEYLRQDYPTETLLADVTFLDFYGGGLHNEDPFAFEINGLRNYFSKHARHPAKAFVLAWTYMPRDRGRQKYIDTLSQILPADEMELLRRTEGVNCRSAALRLLLMQQCREHNLQINLFQHALYKRIMNTMIVVFSRGPDSQCSLPLGDPRRLLIEPCCVYDSKNSVPRLVQLLDLPDTNIVK